VIDLDALRNHPPGEHGWNTFIGCRVGFEEDSQAIPDIRWCCCGAVEDLSPQQVAAMTEEGRQVK
jgi:hypothetical protein